MNQEGSKPDDRKIRQDLRNFTELQTGSDFLSSNHVSSVNPVRIHFSWISGLLIIGSILCPASRLVAGDAVAVGYNSEGIWTAVTYHCSSTPKGGRDYKDSAQARRAALRDLHRRAPENLAKATILAASDLTGYVAVARGRAETGTDANVVGYGKSQVEADKKAFAQLNEARATGDQKIVYRYFSYGADSK